MDPFEDSQFVFNSEFLLFQVVDDIFIRMGSPLFVSNLCVQIGML